MGDLKYLVPILVAVVLVWFTYLIVNFVATIIKSILWNTYCYLSRYVCLLYLLHDFSFIKWRC